MANIGTVLVVGRTGGGAWAEVENANGAAVVDLKGAAGCAVTGSIHSIFKTARGSSSINTAAEDTARRVNFISVAEGKAHSVARTSFGKVRRLSRRSGMRATNFLSSF